MKRLLVASLILVSGVWLSGCSLFGPLQVSAFATPEPHERESGVGGTGFLPGGAQGEEDEGVGGTGIAGNQRLGGEDEGVGGTGIFGVISDFGSIVVNGVHIDYEPATSVSVDGESGSSKDFAIGQTVAVEAVPVGERYQAQLVEIQHAVIGPVESADNSKRTFVVLGQTIVAHDDSDVPIPGVWVKVSGFRDEEDRIIASRLDIADAGGQGLVRGIVTSGQNGLLLSGLPVEGSLPNVVVGDEVLLRGEMGTAGFNVSQVAVAPEQPFGGRMKDLLIDGTVQVRPDGAVYVAGRNWRLPMRVLGMNGAMRPDGLDGRYLLRGPWREDRLNVIPGGGIRYDSRGDRTVRDPVSVFDRGGASRTRPDGTGGLEWPPELERERARIPGGEVYRPDNRRINRPVDGATSRPSTAPPSPAPQRLMEFGTTR
ncbi:MAG: DUF5666 domain-containing protein [Parvibaculum sp.]